MDWLEEELKNALNRKEPSEGFDARVKQAAEAAARKPRVVPMTKHRWLAAAAAIIVLAGAGEGYRWHRGQVAKDQVMLAMRITGGKLNRVQMQIAGEKQ
jgi:hypothetical protein